MTLSKSYVNSTRQHDVVFVVEGKPFYAHKIALSASSEAFRAMFESGCKEGSSSSVPVIDIPNISRGVFKAMVCYLYTKSLACEPGDEFGAETLTELLEVADQYLLADLRDEAALAIAQTLDVADVVAKHDLSEQYNATPLAHAAVAFIATRHEELQAHLGQDEAGLARLFVRVRSSLHNFLQEYLWQQC